MMVKEAELWIDQAESDFKDAALLWKNRRYGATILFYQQAVEKIIKAYIVEYKKQVPKKTHRIEDLLKDAELSGKEIETNSGIKIEELSKAYIRVRYPDLSRQYFRKREKVEPLVKLGKELYIWVKEKFKKL